MSGLTPLEEKFLDRVWAYFEKTGSWPSTSLLVIEFRKEGNARKIAAQIGRDSVVWEGSSTNAACYLTLKGVATRRGSERIIESFLGAVRHLGQRYVETGGDVSVSAEDFVTRLGLSEAEARQAAELILREGDLKSSATVPPFPAWPSFKPYKLAMHLESVQSLDEYWETRDRFDHDEREAASLLHRSHRLITEDEEPVELHAPKPRNKVIAFLEKERTERGWLYAAIATIIGLLLAALAVSLG